MVKSCSWTRNKNSKYSITEKWHLTLQKSVFGRSLKKCLSEVVCTTNVVGTSNRTFQGPSTNFLSYNLRLTHKMVHENMQVYLLVTILVNSFIRLYKFGVHRSGKNRQSCNQPYYGYYRHGKPLRYSWP